MIMTWSDIYSGVEVGSHAMVDIIGAPSAEATTRLSGMQ